MIGSFSVARKSQFDASVRDLNSFESAIVGRDNTGSMKTIKPLLLGISCVTILTTLTGCVIAIGTERHSHSKSPEIAVTDSADAATIAEIDAAGRLSFDSGRVTALSQIAERDSLSKSVQVHLVNTTYRRLSFDNSKVEVLSKIIARSDFCDATRHAIVSQLNKLSFDNHRQQILQQISARLKKSSTETEAAH